MTYIALIAMLAVIILQHINHQADLRALIGVVVTWTKEGEPGA